MKAKKKRLKIKASFSSSENWKKKDIEMKGENQRNRIMRK